MERLNPKRKIVSHAITSTVKKIQKLNMDLKPPRHTQYFL
jgi:hypothetical protein